MRYVVLTAKHHDGLAMYPSKGSKFNLMDWSKYHGPDPSAALKAACHKLRARTIPLKFTLSRLQLGPPESTLLAQC
jgi:hypothetical protein